MVVVTGGAGFIGSALIWELNERGVDDILVVDDLANDSRWKNLSKRNFIDIVSVQGFLDILETDLSKEFETIYHLGACSSTTETDVDYLMENNYRYSQVVFEWCLVNQRRFIYASSGATYGDGSKGFDDQTSSFDLQPLNPYGYSKVLFDRYIEKQVSLPPQCVGLKFFNVFGPQEYHKEDMASVVFKAYNQIKENGSLKLFKSHKADFADGDQLRDFVYIKDITRWMVELLEKRDVSGIYNLGYGKARTWNDLAKSTFGAMGKELKIDWIEIPENIRNQYQYFTEAKMESWLGSDMSPPQWPLEKSIEDYVKNYLDQSDPYL